MLVKGFSELNTKQSCLGLEGQGRKDSGEEIRGKDEVFQKNLH